MIKAITFDFWSTLFVEKEGAIGLLRDEKLLKVFQNSRQDLNKRDLGDATRSAWKYFRKRWLEKKITMTASNYLAFLCKKFNFKLKQDDFDELKDYLENLSVEHPPTLSDGAESALESIRNSYPEIEFAIISDTGLTPGWGLRKIIENSGISSFFSHYTFSDEIKRSKPSKKAFYSTYEKLCVKPEQTVHIGDLEETDIRGAKMWGAIAVLYRGGRQNNIIRSNADYMIDHFNELPGVIEKLNA